MAERHYEDWDYERIQGKLAIYVDLLDQLSGNLADEQRSYFKAQNEIIRMTAEIVNLEERVTILHETIDNEKSEHGETKKLLDGMREAYAARNQDILSLKETIKELTASRDKLYAQTMEQAAEISKLRKEKPAPAKKARRRASKHGMFENNNPKMENNALWVYMHENGFTPDMLAKKIAAAGVDKLGASFIKVMMCGAQKPSAVSVEKLRETRDTQMLELADVLRKLRTQHQQIGGTK